jgi:hypothetical protein
MERQAIEKGLTFLQLEGAKNAKSFYHNLGFRTVSCGEHSILNPQSPIPNPQSTNGAMLDDAKRLLAVLLSSLK